MSEEAKEVWAIVELMGHVKLAGRLTEEEKFGAKMGRLDIPKSPKVDCLACEGTGVVSDHACRMPDCNGFVTQLFGGSSVYRITIVTEDVARHLCRNISPAPVSPWDFTKRIATVERDDDECDHAKSERREMVP